MELSPPCQHPGGCIKPARGTYCSAHRERLRVHGDLGPAEILQRPNPRATFDRMLSTAQPGPCLIWPHAVTTAGYGVLRIAGVLRYAHRLACELVNGLQPVDRPECAHSCNTPACFNPHHLRWATKAENEADKRR